MHNRLYSHENYTREKSVRGPRKVPEVPSCASMLGVGEIFPVKNIIPEFDRSLLQYSLYLLLVLVVLLLLLLDFFFNFWNNSVKSVLFVMCGHRSCYCISLMVN